MPPKKPPRWTIVEKDAGQIIDESARVLVFMQGCTKSYLRLNGALRHR